MPSRRTSRVADLPTGAGFRGQERGRWKQPRKIHGSRTDAAQVSSAADARLHLPAGWPDDPDPCSQERPGPAGDPGPAPGSSVAPVIDLPGPRVIEAVIPTTTIASLNFVPDAVLAPDLTDRGELTHHQVVELYAAHHTSLVRLAALVAPEDGMAEDLVQEAFVRLYKSWRRIREPEKVPAYLRATIVNLARGRGRRMAVAWRNRPAPPDDAASAEDGALRREGQQVVIEALRKLPGRQRECLVLRYYQGLTESEIAETLGIGIGSVRTHTSRGMTALEKILGVPS